MAAPVELPPEQQRTFGLLPGDESLYTYGLVNNLGQLTAQAQDLDTNVVTATEVVPEAIDNLEATVLSELAPIIVHLKFIKAKRDALISIDQAYQALELATHKIVKDFISLKGDTLSEHSELRRLDSLVAEAKRQKDAAYEAMMQKKRALRLNEQYQGQYTPQHPDPSFALVNLEIDLAERPKRQDEAQKTEAEYRQRTAEWDELGYEKQGHELRVRDELVPSYSELHRLLERLSEQYTTIAGQYAGISEELRGATLWRTMASWYQQQGNTTADKVDISELIGLIAETTGYNDDHSHGKHSHSKRQTTLGLQLPKDKVRDVTYESTLLTRFGSNVITRLSLTTDDGGLS